MLTIRWHRRKYLHLSSYVNHVLVDWHSVPYHQYALFDYDRCLYSCTSTEIAIKHQARTHTHTHNHWLTHCQSLESKVSIITGGPGVGKTMILNTLTKIMKASGHTCTLRIIAITTTIVSLPVRTHGPSCEEDDWEYKLCREYHTSNAWNWWRYYIV